MLPCTSGGCNRCISACMRTLLWSRRRAILTTIGSTRLQPSGTCRQRHQQHCASLSALRRHFSFPREERKKFDCAESGDRFLQRAESAFLCSHSWRSVMSNSSRLEPRLGADIGSTPHEGHMHKSNSEFIVGDVSLGKVPLKRSTLF